MASGVGNDFVEKSASYHVRISLKSDSRHSRIGLDYSLESLKRTVIEPYERGQKFLIEGETIDPYDIKQIKVSATLVPSRSLIPAIREKRRQSGVASSLS